MTKEAVLQSISDSIKSTSTYVAHQESIDIVINYIGINGVDMGSANVLITLNEILKEADCNDDYRSKFDAFIVDQLDPSHDEKRKSTVFLRDELVFPVKANILAGIEQASAYFHEYNPLPFDNGLYGLDSSFGKLHNWHRAQQRINNLIESHPEKETLQPGVKLLVEQMRNKTQSLFEFYDWDIKRSYGNLEYIRDKQGMEINSVTDDELSSLNTLIHVLKARRGIEMIRSSTLEDQASYAELGNIIGTKLMDNVELANQMDDWRRGDRGEHLVVVAEACGLDMNRKDLRLLCNTIQRNHDYRIPTPDTSLSPGM